MFVGQIIFSHTFPSANIYCSLIAHQVWGCRRGFQGDPLFVLELMNGGQWIKGGFLDGTVIKNPPANVRK